MGIARLSETPAVVENPFLGESADDYHRFRPYHHERTLRRAFRLASTPPGFALDIACGTGLSTLALHRLGCRAVGIDVSRPMLQVARHTVGVPVAQAAGESLPVPDRSCGLVTCSSGLHWLDSARFWDEARRVLLPGALLIVYDHGFRGEANEVPGFSPWFRDRYLDKYPVPPRNVQRTEDQPFGFAKVAVEDFAEDIPLDHERLVGYLLTQSNTIVVRTTGRESLAEVEGWLASETAPFFGDRTREVVFEYWGRVECLRRA